MTVYIETPQLCDICGYNLSNYEIEDQRNSNIKICPACVEKQDIARYGNKNQDKPRVYQNG